MSFLFVLFLIAVMGLFAVAIISADRFVRTLPPPPGRKHGVVRRWSFRQVGRVATLVRSVVLGTWHLIAGTAKTVRNGLRTERRAAARVTLARLGHRAVEVGFGGPSDEVVCERHVRPRFEGRHPRPERAGEARRRPRVFGGPEIAPHDAFAIVMQTPAAGPPSADA